MRLIRIYFVLFFFVFLQNVHAADQCAENIVGPGSGNQNYTVLVVWAKTSEDVSSFPSWANSIPSTLVDFYKVMSYNQHVITTKIATKNGGFYMSDQGHTVSYYKNQFQQSGSGYVGPWGIFVEEILGKVETDKGANFFDDVDLIMMMVTDGGREWYVPNANATGIAYLGVDYTTANNKTFNRFNDGITNEFASGESATKWTVCHEYGYFLGFSHKPSNYGTYSLMYKKKLNEEGETVTPLCIQNIIAEGWLNLNDSNRVKTVNSNTTNFTLNPVRNTSGIVATKVNIGTNEYFIVNNHQQSTNPYDGSYPASGLLIWHIINSSGDVECATALDIGTYGPNFDHLDLSTSNSNYHGEGLDTDFWRLTNRNTFASWTNPNTEKWTGGFTDISIKIKSQSSNSLILDIFTYSPPDAPQNLTMTNSGQNGQNVNLSWNANTEPDLDRYAIYRGYQYSAGGSINWLSSPSGITTGTSWTDPFVKINSSASTFVHYRITAVDLPVTSPVTQILFRRAAINCQKHSEKPGTTSRRFCRRQSLYTKIIPIRLTP